MLFRSPHILFNTGDVGDYALPFLYIDLASDRILFLRRDLTAVERLEGTSVAPYLKTSRHLVKSHLFDLVLRPVSSVSRLMSMLSGVVRETLRRDPDESGVANQVASAGPMDLTLWEEQLDQLTRSSSSYGQLEYLIDGDAFFTRMIDSLNQAERSIQIRTYIFDNDDYAEKIARLLKRRANEGIEVKVLLDGAGTSIAAIEKQSTLPARWEEIGRAHV